jgi:hypothetical protein
LAPAADAAQATPVPHWEPEKKAASCAVRALQGLP